MHRADRIDPALIENAPKQSPRLWLYKRVLRVGLGWIDVGVGRHDIEIPREHDRRIKGVKLGRMCQSRFIQASLYLNFGPGCGLPLGA